MRFLFLYQVNEKFAIDLVHEEPPTEIDGRSVWCDGGGGALGHPKVYINLVSFPLRFSQSAAAILPIS